MFADLISELINLQVLDVLIGHNDALFRRAQLKALVSIHSQEVDIFLLAVCSVWVMYKQIVNIQSYFSLFLLL